jgi:hypothetical protein
MGGGSTKGKRGDNAKRMWPSKFRVQGSSQSGILVSNEFSVCKCRMMQVL